MADEILSKRTGILGIKDKLKDAKTRAKNSATENIINEIFGSKINDDKDEKEFLENQSKLLDGRIDPSDRTVKGFLQRLAILLIKKIHNKSPKVNIPTNLLVYEVFQSYNPRFNKRDLKIVLYGTTNPGKVVHATFFDDDEPIPNKATVQNKVTILSEKTCVISTRNKEVLYEAIHTVDFTDFEREFYVDTEKKFAGQNQTSTATLNEHSEWVSNRTKFLSTDVFKKGSEDSDPDRVLELIAKSVITRYTKGLPKDSPYISIAEFFLKNANSNILEKSNIVVYGKASKVVGAILVDNKTIIAGSLTSQNRTYTLSNVQEGKVRYEILNTTPVRDFKQNFYIKYYK